MLGTTLNQRFKLMDELGRGGRGVVYRAHDELLDRDVAIKLLSEEDLGAAGRDRLLREAQVVAGLNHPNIVQVHDAGELKSPQGQASGESAQDIPYIVMELIEGQNLHERPPSDLEDIVRVARQVCAALQHAHEHGILHRDLKPENVLVDSAGNAKLSDFGLARSMASRITEEGRIVGTVFYMAPEIARGQYTDGRADLYSLGILLYELTTNDLPFSEGDALAIISQHLHASVVPPMAKNPELPSGLSDLIVRLMNKRPDDRPASAAAVLEELERDELLDPTAPAQKELALLDRIARGRFVGRKEELAELRSLWDRVLAGEGQTLLVSGEPGVGKSRLLREFTTHVEVGGGKVFTGACYEDGGAPYAPFAQIVRQALEAQEIGENGTEPALPEFVLADLLSLAPELEPYYPDIPANPSLEPEAQQQRLFENVIAFFDILSREAPLLVVIEDAHWGDSSSLSLVRHLARRLHRKPLMLVATYREVELDEDLPFYDVLLDLNRERLARRLKLKRLTRGLTRSLLGAVFEEDITDEFLEGVYRETEGNPFFVEEVCKALVESGELYYQGGRWHRPSMAELEIPQSVRVAIQARVSKLPETHQQALRMAAILGRDFDFEALVAASELGEAELIEAVEAAERAQLIEAAGGVRFAFVHALVATTLVEGLHTLRRRIMNRQAAAAIEELRPDDYEALAHHHGEAGNDEQALKYYELAGDQAAEAYANREVEDRYRAALNLAESEVARADLLSKLGLALAGQGQFDEALETWHSALTFYDNAGYPDRVAWCYARSARAAWDSGEVGRGLEICETAVETIGDAPDSVELADLLHETARAYHFNGIPDKAKRFCQKALNMAEELGAFEVQVEALSTWAILEGTPIEEAIASLERAIDLSQSNELLDSEARARNNLAVMVGLFKGEVDVARRHHEVASQISRKTGQFHRQLFYASAETGWAILQGDYAHTEAQHQRLRQMIEDSATSGISVALLNRMEAHLAHFRGEFEIAKDRYRENMEASRAEGSLQSVFWNGFWYADMLAVLREFESARTVLEEVMEIGDKIGGISRPRIQLSWLESQEGEVERAEKLLRAVPAKDSREFAALDLPWFEAAQGQLALASGRMEEAWDHYSQAVRHVKSMGIWGHLGDFLLRWAEAMMEYSDEDDWYKAEELLEQARDHFEDLGAPGYREMAEAKLKSIRSRIS